MLTWLLHHLADLCLVQGDKHPSTAHLKGFVVSLPGAVCAAVCGELKDICYTSICLVFHFTDMLV